MDPGYGSLWRLKAIPDAAMLSTSTKVSARTLFKSGRIDSVGIFDTPTKPAVAKKVKKKPCKPPFLSHFSGYLFLKGMRRPSYRR